MRVPVALFRPAVIVAAVLLLIIGAACGSSNKGIGIKPADCLVDPACKVPLVCAHRGLCGEDPENTLAAYLDCEAKGVPMLEIDTRDSADGVVVLMHDSTLDRTTDSAVRFPGRQRVTDLTAAEFKTLVIKDPRCSPDPGANPDLCHPPTFAQLLQRTKDQTLLFIDFKDGDPANVAAEVLAHDAASRVIFFDSSITAMRAFRAALPGGLVMPRAETRADFEELLEPDKSDLDLQWIHGDPQHVPDLIPLLDAAGIKLYFDVFTDVDILLGGAEVVVDPVEKADFQNQAWEILNRYITQGADGFGTNAGNYLAEYLYPYGF